MGNRADDHWTAAAAERETARRLGEGAAELERAGLVRLRAVESAALAFFVAQRASQDAWDEHGEDDDDGGEIEAADSALADAELVLRAALGIDDDGTEVTGG
jgi:hypothetical protein